MESQGAVTNVNVSVAFDTLAMAKNRSSGSNFFIMTCLLVIDGTKRI